MPRYDFKCGVCKRVVEDRILSIHHTPEDRPSCCDQTMGVHISVAPMVHWNDPVIEPFRNPAAARGDKDEVILNTKQRREFMAKNDLVDANDLKPPTHQEQTEAVAEMKESIKAITPEPGTVPDIV